MLADLLSRRAARNGALAAFTLLVVAPALYGAATMDYARDIFVALRLWQGQEFPLTGPLLNGASLHLGPIWYYLLAAILGLDGRSWLATSLVLGLLAATQIPLAYLAGKALHDRRAGMLWAALLVLPGWGAFNALLPSHPQLAPPLMLAFVLCAIRYARRARNKYLFGMAVCFTLALHAHPAALALSWLGLAVCVRALARGECGWRALAVAAAIALAPLLPSVYADATHGFADLGNANSYLANTGFLANLASSGSLFAATMVGGLRYWLETMLAWPSTVVQLVLALVLALGALGAFGLIRLGRVPATRPIVLAAVSTLAISTITIATLRDITPFYMAAPLYAIGAGAWALGLAGLGASAFAASARASIVLGAFVLAVCAGHAAARLQVRGAWPFGWWPLLDVKQAPSPSQPLLLMPAYAMDASGRFLCSQPAPSLHGVYASHVLMNYRIEMRLACGRSDALAGGAEAGREHWLGLSRALFAQLDTEPEHRLGPLGLVRAQPLPPGRSIAAQTAPIYPAHAISPTTMQESRTQLALGPEEYLVVSNLAWTFGNAYESEVSIDGRRLQAKARDAVSTVYACDACSANAPARIDLLLRSGSPDALDVVVFRAQRAPID